MIRSAVFRPAARRAIRLFPKAARVALGEAILDLQYGARLGMPLSRPMPSVAPGVQELRVRDTAGVYRTFYLVKDRRGILVFHAFEKRAQWTPVQDIELGRRRLREVLDEKG